VILQKCAALLKCVGTLVAIISQLDTQPTCAPVNDSRPNLRLAALDSGVRMARYSFPVWLFHPRLNAGLSRRTQQTAR